MYGDNGFLEDEEEIGMQPEFNLKSYVILLIDCHSDMFINTGEGYPFGTAMKAAFNFYSENIANFLSVCDTLSIVLCHPDSNKQIFIKYDSDVVDSYKKVFNYANKTSQETAAEFASANTGEFSTHLLNALKQSKYPQKEHFILFLTTRADPTTGTDDRFAVMTHLAKLKDSKTKFEVLSLSSELEFEDFYNEAYAVLQQKCLHLYYQEEHLTEKLLDSVCNKVYIANHNLYPYEGSHHFFTVESFALQKSVKLYSNCNVHKTSNDILKAVYADEEDDNTTGGYSVPLMKDGKVSISLTPEQVSRIKDTSKIPPGITLIQAQLEPYSTLGLYIAKPRLIRKSRKYNNDFDEFWHAMKDMYILCYFKMNKISPIRHVELTPVQINDEHYFQMKVLPNGEHLFAEHDLNSIGEKTIDEKPEAARTRQVLFDDLISMMSIENPQELFNNLISGEDAKNIEYFKTQLLGRGYRAAAVLDPSERKLYDASDEDIKNVCNSLDEASAAVVMLKGQKRKRKT